MGRISQAGTGGKPGRGAMPLGTVESCVGITAGLIRQSLSAGTWRAYEKVWQEWFALMEEVGGSGDSTDVQTWVLCFICRNYEKGVSGSGIGKKMAALAFLFQLTN